MAHRIAELMKRATTARTEAEREEAVKACAETILRLWQSRACLPAGAALAPFAELIENFVTEPKPYSPLKISDKPSSWSQALPDVLHLLERELSVWIDVK